MLFHIPNDDTVNQALTWNASPKTTQIIWSGILKISKHIVRDSQTGIDSSLPALSNMQLSRRTETKGWQRRRQFRLTSSRGSQLCTSSWC